MPPGITSLMQRLTGLIIRPALAALCLTLALPAQAGWLDELFGSSHEQAKAAPAAAPLTVAEPPQTPAVTNIITDAATGNASNESKDNNELVGAEDQAFVTPLEEEEGAETDDDILLPNVEESALGEVESPDAEINPDELAEKGDLWARIRDGFQMELPEDNERIAIQRNWYLRNSSYLDRMALRATRYLHYTVTEAEKRGLPTELALLPIIESAYDPFAYSHASAAGMWQFIPGTGKIFGLKQNWWYDGRRDVIESTRAAYDFLSMLYEKFGSWELALAAYNAGPGAVQRAINRNAADGLPTDFWSLRLPAETRAYVPRFLAVAQVIKSPETFGVSLRPVVDQPFFRSMETAGQIDMTAAAAIAGVSLKEFYQLNPGFNRWATDPDGPHRLLVPASLPKDFEAQIAALPVPEKVKAQTYTVRKGDTLYKIARQFDTTAAEIKRLNNLKSDKVAVGRTLTLTKANISPEFVALNQEMRLDRSYSGGNGSSSGKVRKIYTVRRGDTLSSIARRHGVTTRDLARWNGISSKSHISAGQRLSIHTNVSSKQRVAKSKKGGKDVQKISYKVKKGDTLSSIGRRYNVSVKQIKRWNGSSSHLQPGQGLVLFVAGNSRHNL
jgi:membrane-bound lytic murein transglycosylase D